jgi:hypothetical protein
MEEPDALEDEAGKRLIPVMEKDEKLVQFGHCLRKRNLFGTIGAKLFDEIAAPISPDSMLVYAVLIDDPEREVRILLRKMSE